MTTDRVYYERQQVLKYIGFATYEMYLESHTWITIRRRILKRDHGKCQRCGGRASQVHHRNYSLDTLCGDNDAGLVSLCGYCHLDIEFDGDRKRAGSEVQRLDALRGIKCKRAKRRCQKARESAKNSMKARRMARTAKNPATKAQISTIVKMSDDCGEPLDIERLTTLTFGDWRLWVGELARAANAIKKALAEESCTPVRL